LTGTSGDHDILDHGVPRIAKDLAVRYAKVPGVHIMVRTDRCKGCGACVKNGFCRFGAISVTDRMVTIDERRCRRCARCTHLCPRDALGIEVRPPQMVRSALKHIDGRITRLLK
jgi:heterodisulfide reductase subunit A-like polyferredoxin